MEHEKRHRDEEEAPLIYDNEKLYKDHVSKESNESRREKLSAITWPLRVFMELVICVLVLRLFLYWRPLVPSCSSPVARDFNSRLLAFPPRAGYEHGTLDESHISHNAVANTTNSRKALHASLPCFHTEPSIRTYLTKPSRPLRLEAPPAWQYQTRRLAPFPNAAHGRRPPRPRNRLLRHRRR